MQKIIKWLVSGLIGGGTALAVSGLSYDLLFGEFSDQILAKLLFSYKELIVFVVVFAIVYLTIAERLGKLMGNKIEEMIIKYPMQEILMYIIGFSIGLAIANLIGIPFARSQVEIIAIIWSLILYITLGYCGIYIVHLKKEEIKGWFGKKNTTNFLAQPKILDTSVIIDGRILDIIKTHFVEGKIIIPTFVLDELRHIADASDKLKRTKGRRGLDLLKELQNREGALVEVSAIDYPDLKEVDVKLVKLAAQIQGAIVTNDFNLNKVAQVQKVPVLNINELAQAVKPVVLPSEEMEITIVKEGKEQEQGLAYLNDGTMVVIENGKRKVGETVKVSVTTVLQTSAGRMIFAKILK